MIFSWLKHYSWIGAVAMLAALTWWLQNLAVPPSKNVAYAVAHEMDYSMETFTVTEMNATGQPRYRLQAASMEHFADDNSSHLIKPQILFYSRENVPWTLVADEGTVTGNNEKIHLSGDVLIDRAATPAQGPLRVVTRDVTVRPRDEYAETQQVVTLTDPVSTTRATGMQMYVRDERVQLLSQVQGTYAPR